MFFYIRARFHFELIGGNLTAESTGRHREIEGGIQIPFLFQSRRQSAPESLLEGYENNEYPCITLILVYTLMTESNLLGYLCHKHSGHSRVLRLSCSTL